MPVSPPTLDAQSSSIENEFSNGQPVPRGSVSGNNSPTQPPRPPATNVELREQIAAEIQPHKRCSKCTVTMDNSSQEVSQSQLAAAKLKSIFKWILGLVGPETENRPNSNTVCITLVAFMGFILIASLAAAYPVSPLRIVFLVLSSITVVALGGLAVFDIFRNKFRPYRRNLGNTLLTILFTIPSMTLLYALLWQPSLNTEVLQFSDDVIELAQFPAVALFQRNNWTAQANLLGGYSKCFLGYYAEGLVQCSDLNSDQISANPECNCTSTWTTDVIEEFVWQKSTYRYLDFQTPGTFITHTPTTLFQLQVFFNYNVTASIQRESNTPSPGLLLALYDPGLSILEALEKGYTAMNLINANGISAINLGLTYREGPNIPSVYVYDVSISSTPSLDLPCDTSRVEFASYPCYTTLLIQIPSFNRRKIVKTKVMSWTDVVASAGAYYSFVQFVAWIVSGQMFAT